MTRTFAIILAIALASPVLAQPLPVPKSGTCPAGYRESGGYCAAVEASRFAAPAVCSGYRLAGVIEARNLKEKLSP